MSFRLNIGLFLTKRATLLGCVAVLFVVGNRSVVAGEAGEDSLVVAPTVQVFFKHRTTATENARPTNGFLFGRAHFGLRALWSTEWKAELILDAGKPTVVRPGSDDSFSVSEGSDLTMALKVANVQWHPSSAFALHAGAVLQNHYITQERFWGHRYLDQTFQDRYLGIPSTDLGLIGYFGISECWKVDAAVTNGEGFRREQDASSSYKIAFGTDVTVFPDLQTRMYFAVDDRGGLDKPLSRALASLFLGWQANQAIRLGSDITYTDGFFAEGLEIYGGTLFCTAELHEGLTIILRADKVLANDRSGDAASSELEGTACAVGIGKSVLRGLRFAVYSRLWFAKNDTIPNSASIDAAMEFTI
jgi:hypothetical protein